MGQTNPLAKKVYNLRHLFSSIVLLCVNASGLSKRIKSLFRLTTHLLILVYNCISCPRYVHIFLDSIFEGNYTIVRSFSVFEHPVYIKFFILIILHLYWLPIFCFMKFQKYFSKCDIFISEWFISYFQSDTISVTEFNFFMQ